MGESSGPGAWRARIESDPDRGRVVANLVYAAKTLVAERPILTIASARVRRPEQILHRDTDLVIEGFPKSANTFVVRAFSMSQRPMRIAHHTHAPGQVIVACRRRIPVLVLVRRPVDAVARLALVRPGVSLALLLRGWCRFYRPLIPWLDRLVVGRFEDVTTDLGNVMRAMNDRLGTDFTPFEHNEENVAGAFRAMEDEWSARIGAVGAAFEQHVSRPSDERAARVAELEETLDAPRYERLVRAASELYEKITTETPAGPPGAAPTT